MAAHPVHTSGEPGPVGYVFDAPVTVRVDAPATATRPKASAWDSLAAVVINDGSALASALPSLVARLTRLLERHTDCPRHYWSWSVKMHDPPTSAVLTTAHLVHTRRRDFPNNRNDTPVTTTDLDPAPPRRRLHLTLNLEADDLDELTDSLDQIAIDLRMDGREERHTTSGGYRSGYTLHLTCNPNQTGDRFRTELAAWMKQRREDRRNQPTKEQP